MLERTREEREARLDERHMHTFDLRELTCDLWREPEPGTLAPAGSKQ